MLDDLMISCLEWVPVPEKIEGGGPHPYWAQRTDGYWHVRRGRVGEVVNEKGVRYRKALELAREVKQREYADDPRAVRWQGNDKESDPDR